MRQREVCSASWDRLLQRLVYFIEDVSRLVRLLRQLVLANVKYIFVTWFIDIRVYNCPGSSRKRTAQSMGIKKKQRTAKSTSSDKVGSIMSYIIARTEEH